jgi:hypothetical protein
MYLKLPPVMILSSRRTVTKNVGSCALGEKPMAVTTKRKYSNQGWGLVKAIEGAPNMTYHANRNRVP